VRIVYIHQYFCTPRGAGGTRSYEMARRWVAAGHEVEVITSRAADASLAGLEDGALLDGIRIRFVDTAYSNRFGFLRRVLSFAGFAFRSCLRLLTLERADVLLATSTPLSVALPALVGRWLRGWPLVFEVRDVWPDAAIDAGILRSRLLIAAARVLESLAYRSSRVVVALSTGMQDRIRSRVPVGTPIEVIPNASDVALFSDVRKARSDARSRLGVSDQFVIAYIGSLSVANDIPYLLDLARKTVPLSHVAWIFVGSGNQEHLLRSAMQSGTLPNCRLLPPAAKHDLGQYLAAADLGIVSFLDRPTYFDNSPNKFFDYCAAGLPALFTRSTWLEPALRTYEAGWVEGTHSAEECPTLIEQISSDRAEAQRRGVNASRLARAEFDRDLLSARYLQLLERVAAPR